MDVMLGRTAKGQAKRRRAVGVAIGVVGAVFAVATAFGAGTSGGAAVVVNNANQPITGGGSATSFSFKLPDPPGNKCVGNSATDGWTLQSFITAEANNPGDLTFSGTGPPLPSRSLFDTSGAAYRNRNTGEDGSVVDFPTTLFNFDRFSNNGSSTIAWTAGAYEIGIACWKSETQTQDKFWSAVVTFVNDANDPRGLSWFIGTTPPTTSTSSLSTTSSSTTSSSTTSSSTTSSSSSTTSSSTTSSSTTSSTTPTTSSSTSSSSSTTSSSPTSSSTTSSSTSTIPPTTTTLAPTTTTTAAPTTTTTAAPTSTTTAAPTTTVAPTTTTTVAPTTTTALAATSTAVGAGAVSPGSGSAGTIFTLTSSGWVGVVNVTFRSDPISLGTLTANANGVVTGQFRVPASATLGAHLIELSGTGTAGAARIASIPFTVTATTAPLPLTGDDLRVLVLLGLTSIAVGIVLVARRRPGFDGGVWQ